MPHRPMLALLSVLACSLAAPATADVATHRRLGDVLRFALPLGAAGLELARGDRQGLRQVGASWLATSLATEALQHLTHVPRPDGSNDESFPSGHAAQAFVAATAEHRRHGLGSAWAFYGAALYVGWTRVAAQRHTWADIAGSAAVAGVSSLALVTPAGGSSARIVPTITPDRVMVQMVVPW